MPRAPIDGESLTTMPITALYAGLLALLFVVLALRVIGARRGARVPLGDGGDATLLRRIRVHANCAEYVPLALLLIGLAESLKVDARVLHGLGMVLVAGRVVHAVGVGQAKEWFALRVSGMAATFTVIITAALTCLFASVRSGLIL
ncbi:MAG: MAPEG family protein [Hyphomicrobiaceae bacterium]